MSLLVSCLADLDKSCSLHMRWSLQDHHHSGYFQWCAPITQLFQSWSMTIPMYPNPNFEFLELGAEKRRMVLHDVLGKLGTAGSWHRRQSFWAESCKELCSVVCRAQSFHSDIQAWTQCSKPLSPCTEPHAHFPRGEITVEALGWQ